MTEADCEALYGVIRLIYESGDYYAYTFEERYPSLDVMRREIAEAAGGDEHFVFVIAQDNGHPVGFATVRPLAATRLRHNAYLTMGVLMTHRGRGFGRRLLNAAIERLQGSSVEALFLNVRTDNLSAISLYEAAGFAVVTVLEHDIRIAEQYYDSCLMRHWIRGSSKGMLYEQAHCGV